MAEQNETLNDLKKLRDEIRVKMHLGEMEAKEWWGRVEPLLEELEASLTKGVHHATTSVGVVVDELGKAFRRIWDRIEEKTGD